MGWVNDAETGSVCSNWEWAWRNWVDRTFSSTEWLYTDNNTTTKGTLCLKELEGLRQKLLDIGCIEPSSSSFASGLILARKKDSTLRVCVHYRGINKKTILNCYHISLIDNLIDTVGRSHGKIFTTLGVSSNQDGTWSNRQNSSYLPP